MIKSLIQFIKRIPIKAALLLLLLLTALYVFGDITREVIFEKEDRVDNEVFSFLSHFINPHLTKTMIVISVIGSSYFLLPAYTLLVIWLLVKKKKPIAFNAALIGITSSALVFALKNLFHRVRPSNPLNEPAFNFSFPSGHTTTSFIFFGLLIYLILSNNLSTKHKYIISAFLFLLSLMVGISRIYLRKHYATDVMAGFCVGYLWLVISIWSLRRLEKKEPQK